MITIRQLVLTLCLFMTGLGSGFAATAPLSAEASVARYISELLARNNEIRSYYETDRDFYFSEVGTALEKFVDFREVARGVMAKYGTGPNGATDAQLDRFAEVFKSSMIDFYGSALASYGGQEFEILESRNPPRDPENATNVRMLVEGENDSRFEIQYTMFLHESGIWKLKNLYVEGVNLRRQYYSRFDDLMARNDYDIDKVIESWTQAL